MLKNINLQLFSEEEIIDAPDEKKFTQADVDKIIGERLARVKKEVPEDYETLKEISKELEDFEFTGTPKEQAEKLKQHKQAIRQQQELEDLQQRAVDDGITPAMAKKMKDLEDKLEKSTKALDDILGEKESKRLADQQQKIKDDSWNDQVKEFEESFKDTDLNELGKNEKFVEFIEGSGWTLKQAYIKFVKIYGEIESETINKVASKQLRGTSNAKSESSTADYSGLSGEQKADLIAWNKKYPHLAMTVNEFKNK